MQDRMSDQEQIDEVKRLWREYGKPVVIAALFGLLISYGWRYWHGHELSQRNAAGNQYAALLHKVNQGDVSAMQKQALALKQNYKQTIYASLGQLVNAKSAVNHGDFKVAVASLLWVIQANNQPWLVDLAHLNLALVYQKQGQYQLALDQLNLVSDIFKPMVWQQRASVYQKQEKYVDTINALKKSQLAYKQFNINNPFVSLWLAQFPKSSAHR